MENNKIKWNILVWTIAEFNKYSKTIDVNPEWQRLDVDIPEHTSGEPSKYQGIIAAILDGYDIGEIKLCYYEGVRSSIDGGNRKRAIIAFLNNEFPLHKKSGYGALKFKDLSKDLQDVIWNYELRIIQYGELSAETIGSLFRTTNTFTEVNHQEKLNSFANNPVAVLVRRTVRVIPEIGNATHALYDNVNGRYRYLAFNNARLKMEEHLARILYRITQDETPGVSPDKKLREMYENVGPFWVQNPNEQAKNEKKLKNALDFFLKVATATRNDRKQGLTIGQFSLLTRLYFHLKTEYGSFKVANFDLFWREFARAFQKVEKSRSFFKDGSGQDSDRTIGEAFKGFLSFDLPQEWKYNYALKWFLKEFRLKDVVTITSVKRCFTAKEIEDQWREQDCLDYIDGKPLKLSEAVGAHKIAHSEGGTTTLDNLVVVSKTHNTRMGTMNVDDYKASIGY